MYLKIIVSYIVGSSAWLLLIGKTCELIYKKK